MLKNPSLKLAQIWKDNSRTKLHNDSDRHVKGACRCTFKELAYSWLTHTVTYQSRAILDNLPVMLRQRLACVVNRGLFAQVSNSFFGCFLLCANAPLPSQCEHIRFFYDSALHITPSLTMTLSDVNKHFLCLRCGLGTLLVQDIEHRAS